MKKTPDYPRLDLLRLDLLRPSGLGIEIIFKTWL